jgi:hypothetical protein
MRPLCCGAKSTDSFTASKLLKNRRTHFLCQEWCGLFLRHPQGSPVVHSLFTRAKCFSIAARNILLHSGFSEYVEIFAACRTMHVGEAGGRLAILEGELPGENWKRA